MSGRPYSGMDLDLMKRRLEKACNDFLQESALVVDELQFRNSRAGISLLKRVNEIRVRLDRFIREK